VLAEAIGRSLASSPGRPAWFTQGPVAAGNGTAAAAQALEAAGCPVAAGSRRKALTAPEGCLAAVASAIPGHPSSGTRPCSAATASKGRVMHAPQVVARPAAAPVSSPIRRGDVAGCHRTQRAGVRPRRLKGLLRTSPSAAQDRGVERRPGGGRARRDRRGGRSPAALSERPWRPHGKRSGWQQGGEIEAWWACAAVVAQPQRRPAASCTTLSSDGVAIGRLWTKKPFGDRPQLRLHPFGIGADGSRSGLPLVAPAPRPVPAAAGRATGLAGSITPSQGWAGPRWRMAASLGGRRRSNTILAPPGGEQALLPRGLTPAVAPYPKPDRAPAAQKGFSGRPCAAAAQHDASNRARQSNWNPRPQPKRHICPAAIATTAASGRAEQGPCSA